VELLRAIPYLDSPVPRTFPQHRNSDFDGHIHRIGFDYFGGLDVTTSIEEEAAVEFHVIALRLGLLFFRVCMLCVMGDFGKFVDNASAKLVRKGKRLRLYVEMHPENEAGRLACVTEGGRLAPLPVEPLAHHTHRRRQIFAVAVSNMYLHQVHNHLLSWAPFDGRLLPGT
jgi:hypothetical protein